MPRQEPEQVSKSLTQTRRDLLEWGITELFMRAAKGRGASQEQSANLWKKFVRQYYGRKSTGDVILDQPSKARYWCLQFLNDEGFKPVEHVTYRERFAVYDPMNQGNWIYNREGKNWRALKGLTSKKGRRLGWRLYENPDPPDEVEYVYGRPNDDDAA